MIDLRAETYREEYALRLGLPADSDEADVLCAIINMTNADITLSSLQGLTWDMGGRLSVKLVDQETGEVIP